MQNKGGAQPYMHSTTRGEHSLVGHVAEHLLNLLVFGHRVATVSDHKSAMSHHVSDDDEYHYIIAVQLVR